MADHTLILILTAALLAGVGLLLFGIGKFVYGILHYYLRERQPVREFRHPTYGVLKAEGELWSGAARLKRGEIRFTLGGTDIAPADSEMRQLAAILENFAEVHAAALNFLHAKEPEVAEAELDFYSLDLEATPGCFVVSFIAKGDDSRVWWVEFQNEKPKRAGFDA